MKIVVAKAHEDKLKDSAAKLEYDSVCKAVSEVPLNCKSGTISFVFVKGVYKHFERKMSTVCIFVNKTDKVISTLYGKLRLEFKSLEAAIATTAIGFDAEFLGQLNPDEGLLVNLNIPVKGLSEDREILISDLSGTFDDVMAHEC